MQKEWNLRPLALCALGSSLMCLVSHDPGSGLTTLSILNTLKAEEYSSTQALQKGVFKILNTPF